MAEAKTSDAHAAAVGDGAPKRNLKKLAMIVVPVVVLIAGGAGAWFMGLLDPLLGGGEEVQAEQEAPKAQLFVDLPDMLVNINTGQGRTNYLKLKITLQVGDPESVTRLEELQPRLVDDFQLYLRELRLTDLEGSAGSFRLKEELLMRANLAAAPTVVDDVLFKEFLVQ